MGPFFNSHGRAEVACGLIASLDLDERLVLTRVDMRLGDDGGVRVDPEEAEEEDPERCFLLEDDSGMVRRADDDGPAE